MTDAPLIGEALVEAAAREIQREWMARIDQDNNKPNWRIFGSSLDEAVDKEWGEYTDAARAVLAVVVPRIREAWRRDAEWMATYIMGRLPDRNTMTPEEIASYEDQLQEIVERVAKGIGKPEIRAIGEADGG